MGAFGWKSPLPFRLGGGGHKAAEDLFDALAANVGDALTTEDRTNNAAELQATARVLSIGERALERYQRQSDPRKLSQLLERWEQLLGIKPPFGDSLVARRNRVAARLRTNYAATADGISRIAAESFYPWTTQVHYTPLADAVKYWPGGTTLSGFPWYSTVCNFAVEYRKPTGANAQSVTSRREACQSALDEYVPAWATFVLSETQTAGTNADLYGFFLDQENLDLAAFDV